MLTEEELVRYSRQIPVLGREGQEKLRKSTILIAGVGGLGSASSIYLTAAGVGRLILIDAQEVELSNLNRQILHWTNDVGEPKVFSAKEKLKKLNPNVEIDVYHDILSEELARRLVKEADVVIDALDNWEARFILNKVCVEMNKPFIHAGVEGMYGQMLVVVPGKGPCLQCLIPRLPPSRGGIPVLGTTPGILGLMQATEAIKIVTGVGEPAVGKLVIYDGCTMSFSEIKVKRRPSCPVCSKLS
ncbi:MAG: adenylyltransferase [Thermoprotei archaeon]|nr:MAG: adenylyltransferase [Thermoprotei archaeon]